VTRSVVFRPEAEDEVLETRRWYEERREGLGAEFASAVDAIVERIVASPLAFPCAYGETRRAVLRRFPHALYFRVLADGAIVVLALLWTPFHCPKVLGSLPAVTEETVTVFCPRAYREAGKPECGEEKILNTERRTLRCQS